MILNDNLNFFSIPLTPADDLRIASVIFALFSQSPHTDYHCTENQGTECELLQHEVDGADKKSSRRSPVSNLRRSARCSTVLEAEPTEGSLQENEPVLLNPARPAVWTAPSRPVFC